MADEQTMTFSQYGVIVTQLNEIKTQAARIETEVKAQIVRTEVQLSARMDEQYNRIVEKSNKHDRDLEVQDGRIDSLERLRLWFFFGVVVLVLMVVIALLVGFVVIQGMIARGVQ